MQMSMECEELRSWTLCPQGQTQPTAQALALAPVHEPHVRRMVNEHEMDLMCNWFKRETLLLVKTQFCAKKKKAVSAKVPWVLLACGASWVRGEGGTHELHDQASQMNDFLKAGTL